MTLRVTLEIVPFGEEDNKRVIEVINISNWQQVDFDQFDYRVEDNDYKRFKAEDVWVRHNRDDGALLLASNALKEIDNLRKNHP